MATPTLCVIGLAALFYCEVFSLGAYVAGGEWPSRPWPYRLGAFVAEIALAWVAIRGL